MKYNHIDDFKMDELEMLIDKYFECELTEHEEVLLHRIIAYTSLDSIRIRECKAVMCYPASASRIKIHERSTFRKWLNLSVAACIAIILGAGVYTLRGNEDIPVRQCIAYVGNAVIEDEDIVMQLIANDLSAFREASSFIDENMEDDLTVLSNAVNNLEINNVTRP